MQQWLFGTWGHDILAYSRQYPAPVLAVVLAGISIVINLVFGTRGSGSGDLDIGGYDFGDGDGGGCGD